VTSRVTILVHGFNKNKSDMAYLEKGLRQAGHEVFSVNLPTTFCSLEECRNSMFLQINEIIKNAAIVNYVAHSMGGLITRSFIEKEKQCNVGNCVFIATPHNGSKLAKIADFIPLYSTVFKPIKDLLPNLNFRAFDSNKHFKIGVIAGSQNEGVIGKLFLPEENDGRVEVSSVKTTDMDDFVILPYGHADIHHKEDTLVLVDKFLKKGCFL